MGIIEWLTGWEYIGNTLDSETLQVNKIGKNILVLAKRKSDKIFPRVAGNIMHSGHRYVTERGERMASYVPTYTFHIAGEHYVYRIKHLKCRAGEGNGHGFYIGGGMKIWRKKK